VLLAALSRLQKRRAFGLRAVHVNHHLQPAANAWAVALRRAARASDVALRVRHARLVVPRGASLEGVARSARYALLAQELRADAVLLTAQHQDDQLETVLLQLTRGAGVAGLAAMPARMAFGRGLLLRPLLAWPRARIERLAQIWQLEVIEDPSNRDCRFDRNFLRQNIVPPLRARWPAIAATVARSASNAAEAAMLIEEYARDDLKSLAPHAARADIAALPTVALARLSVARQRAVLRQWLRERGCALPDRAHLERMQTELLRAALDRHPEVRWPGGRVWRERGILLAEAPQTATGASSATQLVWLDDPGGPIDRAALAAQFEFRPRQGGERLRPTARGARRTLKDLLRERGVSLAQRRALPLVYAANQLLAVADLWVNHDHPAVQATGSARGRFVWRESAPARPQ
jgi:tRNA(Ile)-lysidine synthase